VHPASSFASSRVGRGPGGSQPLSRQKKLKGRNSENITTSNRKKNIICSVSVHHLHHENLQKILENLVISPVFQSNQVDGLMIRLGGTGAA
jgi:hypothetical protein